jgi:TetR/AcrR family transcriptional regulator, fatty acid metabolism regulator protein
MKLNSDSLFATLKAQRREAAAESVFQAAEEVIVAKGLEGATMQEIARRAGCAAGTLYLYFRNKEDLIRLLLDRHMQRLEVVFKDSVGKTEDGLERLRLGLKASLDYCHAHQLVLRVFFSNLTGSADVEAHLKGAALEAYSRMKQVDIDSMQRAQEARQVRGDIPADELVEMMYGLFNAAITRWCLRGQAPDSATQMKLVWGFLAGGLGISEGCEQGQLAPATQEVKG